MVPWFSTGYTSFHWQVRSGAYRLLRNLSVSGLLAPIYPEPTATAYHFYHNKPVGCISRFLATAMRAILPRFSL